MSYNKEEINNNNNNKRLRRDENVGNVSTYLSFVQNPLVHAPPTSYMDQMNYPQQYQMQQASMIPPPSFTHFPFYINPTPSSFSAPPPSAMGFRSYTNHHGFALAVPSITSSSPSTSSSLFNPVSLMPQFSSTYETTPIQVRQPSSSSSSTTTTTTTSLQPETSRPRKVRSRKPTSDEKSRPTKSLDEEGEMSLNGERRLTIEFDNFGVLGTYPQTYGKSRLWVPDGVSGTFTTFGQRWRFQVNHGTELVDCEDGIPRVCISWTIANVTSGTSHTVCETAKAAMKRDRDGKTVCNRVFREAVILRAKALEACLNEENDLAKVSDVRFQLRALNPKRFSEGPLVFGLRHEILQTRMNKEYKLRNSN